MTPANEIIPDQTKQWKKEWMTDKILEMKEKR